MEYESLDIMMVRGRGERNYVSELVTITTFDGAYYYYVFHYTIIFYHLCFVVWLGILE